MSKPCFNVDVIYLTEFSFVYTAIDVSFDNKGRAVLLDIYLPTG